MAENSPIIFWLRRDLRLRDHPGLSLAAATGRPIIPVFIKDDLVSNLGAAPKWRLGLGLAEFAGALETVGSRMILRQGPALDVLRALIAETGAGAVWWSRGYDPDTVARDKAVKAALQEDGVSARSHPGHLLFEPWDIATGQGGFYRVYTPYWKAVRDREVGAPLRAIEALAAPEAWPASEALGDWRMGAGMKRGAAIVANHVCVGEQAAAERLETFVTERIGTYAQARDDMAVAGTSGLSENLAYGEISPRLCWQAGRQALAAGQAGAETFLKELVWREFAYHLAFHTPHITQENWREEWDAFPWSEAEDSAEIIAWKQGRTGVELVDAAMREMYVTGRMHNRGRMIVASYLTKHLLGHWRIGMSWFADCLIDWDPASNAMGWQWSAGSGPDATPYFRIFNPDTQAQKFDQAARYRARFLAEAYDDHGAEAQAYFDAIPKSWALSPDDRYPAPIVALDIGRRRALDAYQSFK